MEQQLVRIACTTCELRLANGNYLQREVYRHNGVVLAHYLKSLDSLNSNIFNEGYNEGYHDGYFDGEYDGYSVGEDELFWDFLNQ